MNLPPTLMLQNSEYITSQAQQQSYSLGIIQSRIVVLLECPWNEANSRTAQWKKVQLTSCGRFKMYQTIFVTRARLEESVFISKCSSMVCQLLLSVNTLNKEKRIENNILLKTTTVVEKKGIMQLRRVYLFIFHFTRSKDIEPPQSITFRGPL